MSAINSVLEYYYPYLAAIAKNSKNPKEKLSRNDVMRYGNSLRELQRGLTGNRELPGSGYLEFSDQLAVYTLYYWPISFVQTFLALSEIAQRGKLPKIETLLDLGSGPGPNSFAALEFGAKRCYLLDSSERALNTALTLAERIISNTSNFSVSCINLETMPGDALPGAPETCDLIIASHSINELWKNEPDAAIKRERLLMKAWEQLAPDGLLLVIEPSAMVTSRPALLVRDRLLTSLSDAECVAPCPGSNLCPMLQKGEARTCHSTWLWEPPQAVAELARAAGLERDAVKATWYALKKSKAKQKACAAPQTSADNTTPALEGRIVSEPMLNKAGRIRYLVCTEAGLMTVSAARTDSRAEACGFFRLKRGDLVRFSSLQVREGAFNFGFSEKTDMQMIMIAPNADSCPAPARRS